MTPDHASYRQFFIPSTDNFEPLLQRWKTVQGTDGRVATPVCAVRRECNTLNPRLGSGCHELKAIEYHSRQRYLHSGSPLSVSTNFASFFHLMCGRDKTITREFSFHLNKALAAAEGGRAQSFHSTKLSPQTQETGYTGRSNWI